jgi:hypothetical protein
MTIKQIRNKPTKLPTPGFKYLLLQEGYVFRWNIVFEPGEFRLNTIIIATLRAREYINKISQKRFVVEENSSLEIM